MEKEGMSVHERMDAYVAKMELISKELSSNPKFKALERRKIEFAKQGCFQEAMRIEERMERMRDKVFNEFLR